MLCICIQGPPMILKKLKFFFILYQHITAYSSAIKFTGEAYENFSIDPAPSRKNPIKKKLFIPNCQPLLLGENYTGIKA